MKKYLLLVLCSFLLLCSKNDNEDIYTYEFFDNSQLSITQIDGSSMKYGTISTGDDLVFKYSFIADDEEKIADDEYAEFIHFEVDSNLDSFLIEGYSIRNCKNHFNKILFLLFS
ncbi:MAG: hypothetical protein WA839_11805 [Flavobacteriaceae bacterium]|tara:strand:- start:3244 stop:3585 length:342 start_codon:yes stop_codon:yes gene_type:complete